MFVLETRLWQFVVHFLPTALSCMWVLPRFDSATPRVKYDGHSIRVHGVFNSIVGQSTNGTLVLVSPLAPLDMRDCHANSAWRLHLRHMRPAMSSGHSSDAKALFSCSTPDTLQSVHMNRTTLPRQHLIYIGTVLTRFPLEGPLLVAWVEWAKTRRI